MPETSETPTPYLAPNPGTEALPPNPSDATAEFARTLQDPNRWIIRRSVPVFKCHSRVDPATGKQIVVDPVKLQRIAENMQRMEKSGGVPVRITLGHTEPGKPEVEQPPVAGYYRNARIAPFGPSAEPAIIVDEWLDPQYGTKRKNFPYRSSEYYDDTEQITGVALLTRDPFLDLGVVAYERQTKHVPYHLRNVPGPTHYDNSGRPLPQGYRLVLGEAVMPETVQPNPAPAQPAATVTPEQPQPTPYAAPNRYSGPWPGPAHTRANIGHAHPSGGAVYADEGATEADMARERRFSGARRMGNSPETQSCYSGGRSMNGQRMYGRGRPGRYADEGMGGGADMSGDVLQVLGEILGQAVEVIQGALQGNAQGPGSPPGPMGPGGGSPGGEENMGYARNSGPRRSYGGGRRPYARYSREQEAPVEAPRTISGLPVGYQLEVDKLKAKLRTTEDAMKVLFYERDQADSEACVEKIRRLADVGYDVGEFEIAELKKRKTPQDRQAYLDHIATKYQRGPGQEMPPAFRGDPTPEAAQPTGPMTQEQMHQMLDATRDIQDPAQFAEAVRYARANGTASFPPVQSPFNNNPFAG